MITDQIYGQTTPDQNPIEDTVPQHTQQETTSASPLPRYSAGIRLSERGEHIVIPAMRFVDNMHDPRQMNMFRDAVRSWFCCWVPQDVREGAHGPEEQEGIELFQDLDMFFSDLIKAGLAQQKQELKQLRDYKDHVIQTAQEMLTRHSPKDSLEKGQSHE